MNQGFVKTVNPPVFPDTQKIKQAALAATQGEWYHSHGFTVAAKELNYGTVCDCEMDNEYMSQNATHIAEANPTAVIELATRLEAAEKDAARYRWMRDNHDTASTLDGNIAFTVEIETGVTWTAYTFHDVPMPSFDDAVDSAMKGSE